VHLIVQLCGIEYVFSQCGSVMYKNEKYDIVNDRPSYASCKGEKTFRRTSDQQLFCLSRTPSDTKPAKLSCAAQACKCGKSQKSTARVVGGEILDKNLYPWLSYITTAQKDGLALTCTASIISNRAILTAAHCVTEKDGTPMITSKVFMGAHNTTKRYEDSLVMNATIITHESFKFVEDAPLKNDIALLITDDVIKFTDDVRPVCLPSKTSKIPDEGRLYSGGWGNFASLMEWLTANTDYKHKRVKSENQNLTDDELKEKVRVIINDKMVEIFDGFQNYYDKENFKFNIGNKSEFAKEFFLGIKSFVNKTGNDALVEEITRRYKKPVEETITATDFSNFNYLNETYRMEHAQLLIAKIFMTTNKLEVPKRAENVKLEGDQCPSSSLNNSKDADDMICIKEKTPGSGQLCHGDSGSPLISTLGNTSVQYGIMSTMSSPITMKRKKLIVIDIPFYPCNCNCPNQFQLAIDVRKHLDWIYDKLRRNNAMPTCVP